MERFICIHGHFYQPPRENAWLEAIELQDSAYPYHDWNERITAECYAPNAASRILDGDRRIVKIINNYSHISFNFGPTLLAWMEAKTPEVYEGICDADRDSQTRFSGHGSAVAQAYNHMILPLANSRDKRTQIVWGIRDFQHRFHRLPEGMWLAETAVDLESLELMAEYGIQYTILAPHQASRFRKLGTRKWTDVAGGHIDPTMPYEARLPSGRRIALFFYDGPISRGIAFERLLSRGEDFAHRLLGAFSHNGDRTWPQLVHIATDGETYGHHHSHGDMALAYALEYIEKHGMARLTNYGEYLEKFPPTHQAEIFENTAWSCAHGVERWRSHCGCNSGGRPDWNQAWRGPLRAALDWLRDELAPRFEEAGRRIFTDPWQARDDYIAVILDRSPENVALFLGAHELRELTREEKVTALKLLEMQRQAMLMYTSCGWFFDELSGIETVQVIQYAGRAVQLAEELFGDAFENEFLARLELAKSNLVEHRDGRQIYEKFVKPASVDLTKVAAHYAATSLFTADGHSQQIYCYHVESHQYDRYDSGRTKLAIGRLSVTSKITLEAEELGFACMHFGDHNLIGGVQPLTDLARHTTMVDELTEAFSRADFPETIRRLDRNFVSTQYSLRTLFRDEQRRILNTILEATLAGAEGAYRTLYEQNAPLMRYLAELGVPMPTAFQTAAEFILNNDLCEAFRRQEPELHRIQSLLREADKWRARLDTSGLSYTLEQALQVQSEFLRTDPDEIEHLRKLEVLVELARAVPFKINLYKAQNTYHDLLHHYYPEALILSTNGDERSQLWVDHFRSLGEKLSFRVS